MLYTKGYSHEFRICNTYCFFSATTVARTRLNVTLYLHCVSCLLSADYSGELPRQSKHKGTTKVAKISKARTKRHIRNKVLHLIYCKLKFESEKKKNTHCKSTSQAIPPPPLLLLLLLLLIIIIIIIIIL